MPNPSISKKLMKIKSRLKVICRGLATTSDQSDSAERHLLTSLSKIPSVWPMRLVKGSFVYQSNHSDHYFIKNLGFIGLVHDLKDSENLGAMASYSRYSNNCLVDETHFYQQFFCNTFAPTIRHAPTK